MKRLALLAAILLAACSGQAPDAPAASTGTPAPGYGGARGADLSIDAISPTDEPLSIGMAGDDPADIARYVLASGAASAQLSPDGSWVAFSWRVTGEPQLWVVPATGGQPNQLTFANGITFFRWSPDSQTILYGADNNGNEQESYNLIAVDGLQESELVPAAAGAFRVFGGFLPDGQSVLFSSPQRNGSDFDLYMTMADGLPSLVAEGHLGTYPQSVAPDGSFAVVTESVGEDADKLMLLDLQAKTLATLAAPEPRANHADGGFAWLPDSKGFYFASNEGREFAALVLYDLASNSTTLVHAGDFDVANVSLCGPNGQWLVWTTNEDGFYRLHAEERLTGAAVALPPLPEGVYALSCDVGSSKLAINVNGWATPGDIAVVDLAAGTLDMPFRATLAGLTPARLVRPVSLRMPARDGVELQGLFYLPDAASLQGSSKPPVLFDVHGGPSGQSMANFSIKAQYYADRGIAVFQPNVRGSTGLGRTYSTLDDQTRRLDSVRDLVDMLAFLQQDGRVDTARAAVSGGSYGGYMVNAVTGAYPDAFKVGISMYGVGNWVGALEIASPGLKASDKIEYGDIAEEQWQQFYAANSPINNANAIKVPMLYSHGMMDPRIDISETEVMVKALRSNNIEAEFIRIPDEGHGWRKLNNRLFYFRREAEFLARHLQGVGE